MHGRAPAGPGWTIRRTFQRAGRGLYSRGFGGDTLNTAVYLARLEVKVDYFTALGDDALSDEMIAAWTAEGVGTRRVARLPGKLPGLYMIQLDAKGERQFFHWRDSAAARQLMNLPETDDLLNSLMSYDIVYLSAITLSIYDAAGRERLFAAIKRARLLGTRFVFDTNFRARGWPDREVAREVFSSAFAAADIVLTSTEDLLALYPGESHEQLMARIPSPELVFRLAEPVSLLRFPGALRGPRRAHDQARGRHHRGRRQLCGAYIAARLAGSDPVEAAQAGHRLASLVICYSGAIIPGYAMPPKKRHRPATTRQATK